MIHLVLFSPLPHPPEIIRPLAAFTRNHEVLTKPTAPSPRKTRISTQPRFNELGVQQLPSSVHSQLFPPPTPPPPELINLSQSHLARHDLLRKSTSHSPPIVLELPTLQGKTLDEHFYKLGMATSEPYLSLAREFALADLPPPPGPGEWVRQSGWTKYYPDGRAPESVYAPEEECVVFDIEVLYNITPFSCMACAASPQAWYAWLSPWVLGESEDDRHLIPLGDPDQHRVVVGHNVSFDRARVKEEYSITQTKSAYLDTMSFHIAASGMASRQKPAWMRHKRDEEIPVGDEGSIAGMSDYVGLGEEAEERWLSRSTLISLKDVAKFHCDIDVDKTVRDQFGILDPAGVRENLDNLLSYCAEDVVITHQVYKKVLPGFLGVCPHPVSFGALRHIAATILPVNRTWETYIDSAEDIYQRLSAGVQEALVKLAQEAMELKDQPDVYNADPWLQQFDWSVQELKMTKTKAGEPERPSSRQKMPGMPKWYKDLFPNAQSDLNLSIRGRVVPLLLKLMWDGHPLIWNNEFGWVFRVPVRKKGKYKEMVKCNIKKVNNELRKDVKYVYFKLPHKDGPRARCGSPMAKSYLQYSENGTLSSEYALAKQALDMNMACSYWVSARDRIRRQMVVWESDINPGITPTDLSAGGIEVGLILPWALPMGTITRRAAESTWLVAANPKPNRIGSELKAMVTAPPGYAIVGADVDSEEIWIASLLGDAQFRLHGGSALGFMNLEGTKNDKTDVHSKTAEMLGISRDSAKIFNYGRIYGASAKFAALLLRQLNPTFTVVAATQIANDLYAATKGRRTSGKGIYDRKFWRGGTESFMFNKLEELVEQEAPRTPVLAAGITQALMRKYLNNNGFLPSRINWAIQSSGVDYLHLLIVSMDYLIRRYNLDARLVITVHDEIRYLAKEEDKYRVAMALQVANVWTQAMFSQQMGIDDLPQKVAYLSAVDIDHVLRKTTDMPCVTPSHLESIPSGESLDITALLEKGVKSFLDPSVVPNEGDLGLERWVYTPREPVMEVEEEPSVLFMKAQITADDAELNVILKEARRKQEEAKENGDEDEPDDKDEEEMSDEEEAGEEEEEEEEDLPKVPPYSR